MPMDWSDNIVVCDLRDEPALSEEMNELHQKLTSDEPDKKRDVVLDMGEVTYLNSSNIAQLLKIRKALVERDKKMRLCSVSDSVWSIMLLTGLDKVFDFAPDKATAIAGLQIGS